MGGVVVRLSCGMRSCENHSSVNMDASCGEMRACCGEMDLCCGKMHANCYEMDARRAPE